MWAKLEVPIDSMKVRCIFVREGFAKLSKYLGRREK